MSSFWAAGEAGAPPEKWEKVPTAGNVHAVPGQASESGIVGVDKLWWKMGAGDR